MDTIDSGMAKRLQEAAALRAIEIVGQPGGWMVILKLGLSEKILGTQRTRRPRTWRSLDTLMDYLRTELKVVRIDRVDASGYTPGATKARPDTSARLRQAHRAVTDLKGMVPAPATPVPVDAMMVFQAEQIAAGAGRGVDLKAAIDEGRM